MDSGAPPAWGPNRGEPHVRQLDLPPGAAAVLPPSRAEDAYRMIAAGGDTWMSVFFNWD
jgi:hypothetical protein